MKLINNLIFNVLIVFIILIQMSKDKITRDLLHTTKSEVNYENTYQNFLQLSNDKDFCQIFL
jgi:hypothetical protein